MPTPAALRLAHLQCSTRSSLGEIISRRLYSRLEGGSHRTNAPVSLETEKPVLSRGLRRPSSPESEIGRDFPYSVAKAARMLAHVASGSLIDIDPIEPKSQRSLGVILDSVISTSAHSPRTSFRRLKASRIVDSGIPYHAPVYTTQSTDATSSCCSDDVVVAADLDDGTAPVVWQCGTRSCRKGLFTKVGCVMAADDGAAPTGSPTAQGNRHAKTTPALCVCLNIAATHGNELASSRTPLVGGPLLPHSTDSILLTTSHTAAPTRTHTSERTSPMWVLCLEAEGHFICASTERSIAC